MLDTASAPTPVPAASLASAATAPHAAKDEAGFQDRLRKVLEASVAEPNAGQPLLQAPTADPPTPEAAKPMIEALAPRPLTVSDKIADALPEFPLSDASIPFVEAVLALAVEQSLSALPATEGGASFLTEPSGAEVAPFAAAPFLNDPITGAIVAQIPAGQVALVRSAPSSQAILPALPPQTEGKQVEAALTELADMQPIEQQRGAAALVQALPSNLPPNTPQESAAAQPEGLTAALTTAPAQLAAHQSGQAPQSPGNTHKASSASKDNAISARDKALRAEKLADPAAQLAHAIIATEAGPEVKIVLAAATAEASFRLTSLEAPKIVVTKPLGEGRADGLALQAPGFALPDGMMQRADAPLPSAAPRDMPAPLPARQLAPVVVALALGRGDEALTITLDPGELGRVEVSLGQGKEAGQIRIVAERPETLALLQRDQRELDRALTQAGLGDMARSLSFSLASDQGRQQHHGAAYQGGQHFLGQGLELESEGPVAPIPNLARSATSLLDIAV